MNDMTSRLKSLMAEPSRDTPIDPHRLARVERTRAELGGQGAAISTTLAAEAEALNEVGKRLRERRIDRIVIAGCGDSWFAGMGVRHALEKMTGLPIEAAQALEFASYGFEASDSHTLVVGISSGGNTPAVMQALKAVSDKGSFTLGVSNTPGSPILTSFEAGLVVHASRKGWPTQSTNATMALLVALGAELAKDDAARSSVLSELAGLPALIDALCAELDPSLQDLAESWAEADLLLFAGLGPNYAAASIGAAKVRELSPIHAFALPLEEYHHYRSQKAGDPLVLIATDPASAERALDTVLVSEAVGGRIAVILSADAPEIQARADVIVRLPAVISPLASMVSVIPLHLLAYHFAKARAARNLGAPRSANA
jgi:glucosamine--fructose-6-phosphate aminotransferase (isomerizing)